MKSIADTDSLELVEPSQHAKEIRIPATYANRLRTRIKAAKVLTRLQDCVMGKIEMDAQQVAAARILLNKVLPDAAPLERAEKANQIKDVSAVDASYLLDVIEGELVNESND